MDKIKAGRLSRHMHIFNEVKMPCFIKLIKQLLILIMRLLLRVKNQLAVVIVRY